MPPAPTLGKRAAWRGLCCASSSALLSLLVVGCFECFGFPVKCAEASCLWKSFFMVFPLVAVTWNTNFAILGVPNLYFYMPGASIFHPGDRFVSLGIFEGTTEGHMEAQKGSPF